MVEVRGALPVSEVDAKELLKRGNDPLVWDLEKIQNRSRAIAFIMQFKKTLCVYSGPVQQLYSNYDIFLPELPKTWFFHKWRCQRTGCFSC